MPDADLQLIQRWALERVPVHLWEQLKVELDVSDRHVDIVEVCPPWDGVGEHTRFPIARLRYTKSTGVWAIYWRDRNLKFHEYKRKPPSKNVLSRSGDEAALRRADAPKRFEKEQRGPCPRIAPARFDDGRMPSTS